MANPNPTRRLIPKILAVLILSSIFSWKFHFDRNERVTMGRTAYLAKQGDFYDRYYQHLRPWLFDYLAMSVGFGITITVYELFSFGIFKAFKAFEKRPNNDSSAIVQ
jgi:hypothetical protein